MSRPDIDKRLTRLEQQIATTSMDFSNLTDEELENRLKALYLKHDGNDPNLSVEENTAAWIEKLANDEDIEIACMARSLRIWREQQNNPPVRSPTQGMED